MVIIFSNNYLFDVTKFYFFKKNINNSNSFLFFQLFRAGTLFLIAFIITKNNPFTNKLCLKVSEIGVYEQFYLLAGFVCVFWLQGLLQGLLTIFNNNYLNKNEKQSSFFNVFLLFSFFGLVAAAILIILKQPIAKFLLEKNATEIPYFKLLIFYIIFSCPANLVEHFYFLKNKAIENIIYTIITFSLQLFFIILPIWFKNDLGYGLYGLIFVNIIRFIWAFILTIRFSIIKFSFSFIRKFLSLSAPLIFCFLISGLSTYLIGFLIIHKFGEANYAIFKYGKEFPVFPILINAYASSILLSFSVNNDLKLTLSNLKSGILKLMHLIFPLSVILVLSSKYLYPILYNNSFDKSYIFFNLYFFLLPCKFIFSRTILLGFQKTRILFWSSFCKMVITIILSLIFIRFFDIIGILFAIIIADVVENIILMVFLKQTTKIKLNDYINIKWLLFYSIILFISIYFICICIA